MKAYHVVVLFLFLLLVVAVAQQTNSSPSATNLTAFAELKAKAEKGDANAQTLIGSYYLIGQDVPTDYAEAVKWLRKAVEQRNAIAQYILGGCYRDGKGVPKNAEEAVRWYRLAAEQGIIEAQYSLGVCYHAGEGVEKDPVEEVKWYRKAADQNDAKAQYNLACCYSAGEGVVKDDMEAVNWFRKAADQNDANAQCNLGCCYANGDGVPRNYIEAYKWESLAAAQGINMAKNYLSSDEMRMTPEQIAEAQRLAAAFIPRKESPSSSSANSTSPTSPSFTGTGFFITDDGYLISNYHVVKDAAKVRLLTGAGLIDATVVKVDAANDLALLKANAEGRMQNAETFKPLPIAASRTVKLGGTVATVGFPDIGLQGFAPKLAKGEIASLAGAADDPRYFQISLPVQHGNSGGALVDVRGNVVGIVSAKLSVEIGKAVTSDELPENVNYAVKSSFLLSFLESVPDVSAKLKDPLTADRKFEDVVKSAQDAAVLVLVY